MTWVELAALALLALVVLILRAINQTLTGLLVVLARGVEKLPEPAGDSVLEPAIKSSAAGL